MPGIVFDGKKRSDFIFIFAELAGNGDRHWSGGDDSVSKLLVRACILCAPLFACVLHVSLACNNRSLMFFSPRISLANEDDCLAKAIEMHRESCER